MDSNLPPLAAVRVFEAAAKFENFTRASEELGMTQSAVSYQIRILEERIGAELFFRQPRGVELTETGRRLLSRISAALDQLRDAFAEAKGRSQETLVISVAPTFASNVLAPRLGHFYVDNPDIAVRIEVSQSVIDFSRGVVDLAIRSGSGGWAGLNCHLLVESVLTPMLGPALAETIGGVREPADLLKLPLLNPADPWWRNWFAAADIAYETVETGDQQIQFNAQILEANAVIAGQGVGRLTPALHRTALQQQLLLQPFDLTWGTEDSFWLVYPQERRNSPKIRAFRAWIEKELQG